MPTTRRPPLEGSQPTSSSSENEGSEPTARKSEASLDASKMTATKSLRERLIEQGWEDLDPDEARRRTIKEIKDDVAAWEKAGRPPREEWDKISPLAQRFARAARVQPLDEWLKERRAKKK